MVDGRWKMEDGRWKMDEGRWKMVDGRRGIRCKREEGRCGGGDGRRMREEGRGKMWEDGRGMRGEETPRLSLRIINLVSDFLFAVLDCANRRQIHFRFPIYRKYTSA